ncbi:hypothetical protein PIROE2DRAFT_15537 [Piromyces sp. E2]|nr:hypothetical protein PIROE2DRAFT_15537 [Piromyces sp. E2]|eukprot:OUM59051.1 hypothetical protein PIROE2DRAFT_15537 [Piromyces sp. E2]
MDESLSNTIWGMFIGVVNTIPGIKASRNAIAKIAIDTFVMPVVKEKLRNVYNKKCDEDRKKIRPKSLDDGVIRNNESEIIDETTKQVLWDMIVDTAKSIPCVESLGDMVSKLTTNIFVDPDIKKQLRKEYEDKPEKDKKLINKYYSDMFMDINGIRPTSSVFQGIDNADTEDSTLTYELYGKILLDAAARMGKSFPGVEAAGNAIAKIKIDTFELSSIKDKLRKEYFDRSDDDKKN